MSEVTEHKVDRSEWGQGPWDREADRYQWRTKSGLPGLIVRNQIGALCGYAAVPPSHPLHGRDYDEVDVEVHGDLTYSDRCVGHICHVPEPGEPDNVWWFGFDCAHSDDVSPRMMQIPGYIGPFATYKAEPYVRAQVEELAYQLLAWSAEKRSAADRSWPEDGAP